MSPYALSGSSVPGTGACFRHVERGGWPSEPDCWYVDRGLVRDCVTIGACKRDGPCFEDFGVPPRGKPRSA